MTSPVRRIHVSDRKNFGIVRFSAAELGLDALARVVVARDLGRALLEHIAGLPNVDYFSPAAVDAVEPGRDRVTLRFEAGAAGGRVDCSLLVAADAFDALNERERKRRRGSIGSLLRASQAVKPVRSTAPIPSFLITAG